MTAFEVNFDGLVGPTHNYGGLSQGNLASMNNLGAVSNPRAAALQGIEKMRKLKSLGLMQGVLPPQDRPHVRSLRKFGFVGTDAQVVEQAGKQAPLLLANLSSAASMWTANAATVSPSADTQDGKVHFTPANLCAMFHRSIEHETTSRVLKRIFADDSHFAHHDALATGGRMGDEGAANHGRLCEHHGAPGLELFVYGRSAFERPEEGRRFDARQALESSQAIALFHGLSDAQTLFIRQSAEAIDAGAFHNDVVSVTNGRALMFHEKAFEDRQGALDAIHKSSEMLGFSPILLEARAADVPLEDAIKSYLFNSQLVTLEDGGMALILPTDVEETPTTRAWVEAQVNGDGPIKEAHFMDLKQSMRNGGGPACLRLRFVLTSAEITSLGECGLVDNFMLNRLEDWVNQHYRDRLSVSDLADPKLLEETREALDELTHLLDLGSIYEFQKSA